MRVLKLCFLGLLILIAANAQSNPPDCTFTAVFSSATAGTAQINKGTATGGTPCVYWIFSYWTNGASGVSVKLEGAKDVAGAADTSYTALTAAQGTANPATGTTSGAAILCCDYYPWLRINPTTFTGTSQTMTARAYGWKTQPAVTSGSSDSAQACSNPAIVTQVSTALSTSGAQRIITGTASKRIRFCSIHFSTAAPEDVTMLDGTGAACAGGTPHTLDKFLSVTAAALDYQGGFAAADSNDFCVNPSAVQAIQVTAVYVVQ